MDENILIQVQCEGDYWSWKISYPDGSNMTSGEEVLSERGAWEEVFRRMVGAAPCTIVQKSRDERKALIARAASAEATLRLWQHFAAGIARQVARKPDEFPFAGDITNADLGQISSAVAQMVCERREAIHEAAVANSGSDKNFLAFREQQEKAEKAEAALASARAEGAEEERAAVVAWLRRNPGVPRAPECITAMTPFECADAIKTGRHVRRTKGA